MKRGSFDDRVAKCLAQFQTVEDRSTERSERLGLQPRTPAGRGTKDGPSKS